jgi:methylmalonyl-CoA/ethylmalonyl-CoA epimerase
VLDHSAVIGPWGDIFVELAEVHEISPEPLAEAFLGSPAGPGHPNHISYVVPDPEAEGRRLEALGLTKFWHASRGPLEISYYDGRDINGLAIEIHRLSDAFTTLFDRIGAAAVGWDGSDPVRDFPL